MSSADTTTLDELLDMVGEAASSFPPPRAGTELILTAAAPNRAHASWHIDPADLAAARERAATAPLVIRLHDTTGITFDGTNPNDTHDTVVHGDHGHADLHLRKSGRTCLAELGLRRPDGHLERLALSDALDLPHDAPPARIAAQPTPDIGELAREGFAGLASRPAPAAAPEKSAAIWPDAAELTALLPDRSEYVEAWHERFAAQTTGIEAAHEQMYEEVGHIAFTEILPAVPELAAHAPQPAATETPAAPAPHKSSGDPQTIRLEDQAWCPAAGVALEVVLEITGRVPHGTRASLFNHPVELADDGTFHIRRVLRNPGELLPALAPHLRPPRD